MVARLGAIPSPEHNFIPASYLVHGRQSDASKDRNVVQTAIRNNDSIANAIRLA
jgi:hypothetical protein